MIPLKRTNKHQATKVSFTNMVGGINVSQVPEQIATNEMQECENFIYERDSLRLVGRGGLSAPIFTLSGENIKELYYDNSSNTIMAYCSDRSAYHIDYEANNVKSIGNVTGDSLPVTALFQDKLWVASGGKIQYYAYNAEGLQTVTNSPTCDITFRRASRLFCTLACDDNAYYSSVGDGTAWEDDTNVSSEGQWAQVGGGDGGKIIAVVPMSTDMYFIKNSGDIYQFVGDNASPDSWSIVPVASGIPIIGKMLATNIGNQVVYISLRGLRSLSNTMDYGNVATNDIGSKFNKLITTGLVDTARMWHLRRHNTLLIRPTSDKKYIISYNYLLGAATILRFGINIDSVCETSNDLLVASGSNIYKISDVYVKDNGVDIDYIIKPKDIIGSDELLVKAIDTKFTSDHAGTATVATNSLSVTMPTNSRRKVRCNHSTDCISLTITSKDRFEFDHITLDVADL